MKASELAKALSDIVATNGDYDVNISLKKQVPDPAQSYLMSEPTTVIVEEYGADRQISIRDWPY